MVERYIGLCMAAGGVTVGFDLILGEIRRGRAAFVLIAEDASDRTKKQLTDKCKYYNTKFFIKSYNSAAIAHMLGKKSSCAAAAFSKKGPWERVYNILSEADNIEETEKCCDERKDD